MNAVHTNTQDFYHVIQARKDFYYPYQPQANILCFHYSKYGMDNDFQLSIRQQLVKEGLFYITSAEVNGIRYLRLSVMNELTQTDHLINLLKEIERIAAQIDTQGEKPEV